MREKTNGSASKGHTSAVVILTGITASHAQRRRITAYARSHCEHDVYAPYIPFAFGLRLCSTWIAAFLNHYVFSRNYAAVHFLNFIGGSYLFRALGRELHGRPIGRVIHIRSPIQEEVPRELARRYTRLGLTLLGGKMLSDLSTDWIRALPFPEVGQASALMIETGASEAARSLGLDPSRLPAEAWRRDTLLPAAADVLELPLSHDEIYDTEWVLDEALAFLGQGRFMRPPHAPPGSTAAPARGKHAS